jgi:hypothetical protein
MNPETGRLTKEEFTVTDSDVIDDTLYLTENPDYEIDGESDDGAEGYALALAEPPLVLAMANGEQPISDWSPPSAKPKKNKGKGKGGKKAAKRKAKGKAREKNKKKQTGEKLVLGIGNPLVAAGQTFNLEGCGVFDGKYIIEEANHKLHGSFETEINVRRCLEGY